MQFDDCSNFSGGSFIGFTQFSHMHAPISAYLWGFGTALSPPDFSCLGLPGLSALTP